MKKILAGVGLSASGAFLFAVSYLSAAIYANGGNGAWVGIDHFIAPLVVGATLLVVGILLIAVALFTEEK